MQLFHHLFSTYKRRTTANVPNGEVRIVKTALTPKKPKKEVNLTKIDADDLASIQAQDPFLYYSIPGVRSARLLMEDVDLLNLESSRLARISRTDSV